MSIKHSQWPLDLDIVSRLHKLELTLDKIEIQTAVTFKMLGMQEDEMLT